MDTFNDKQRNQHNMSQLQMCAKYGAVVVAQLVERSLPIPEVHSSNPVIGKIYIEHLFTINCIEKTKINKRGREWPTFKKEHCVARFILNLVPILM